MVLCGRRRLWLCKGLSSEDALFPGADGHLFCMYLAKYAGVGGMGLQSKSVGSGLRRGP